MYVQFIAHAGIAIEQDGYLLMIDPWFTDSTLESPLLEGLSGMRTIDFQIPPTAEKIESYAPQGVFVSHFHPHHSSKKDVTQLIENGFHDIVFGYPDGPTNARIQEVIGKYSHVSLHPAKDLASFVIGPFTITALTHTVPGHIAWSVKSKTGHILHIADGRAHTDPTLSALDPIWEKFEVLRPDIVFMSAGRNSYRTEINGKRIIGEAGCFSPIQAARLIERLGPKIVSSIGNHNHSIWKNRNEFIPDTSATEEELRWALHWLAPKTKYIQVRPGHSFLLGEELTKDRSIDTYLNF